RAADGPLPSRVGMASSAGPPLATGSPNPPGGRKVALEVVTRTSTRSGVGLGLVTSTWAWWPPPFTPPANDQAGRAAPWAGSRGGDPPPLLTAGAGARLDRRLEPGRGVVAELADHRLPGLDEHLAVVGADRAGGEVGHQVDHGRLA